MTQRAVLDRGAGQPQRPPSPPARRRPPPAWSRIVRSRGPGCARSWVSASASRAASGKGGVPEPYRRCRRRSPVTSAVPVRRGQDLGQVHDPDAGRCRDRQPPMCIRHELSPAHRTSAPVSSTWRTLSAPIATDVSAFFTANVPPKPQHASAPAARPGRGPRTARSSRSGRSPTPSMPQRVAGRVVGDPVREVRADVGHPEHVDEELATARSTVGATAVDRARRARRRPSCGQRARGGGRAPSPRTSPTASRRRRTPRRRRRSGATSGHGLVEVAGVECIWPQQVCPAGTRRRGRAAQQSVTAGRSRGTACR